MYMLQGRNIFLSNFGRHGTVTYTRKFCVQGSGRLKRVLLTRKTAPGFEKCLGCFTRNVFTRGFDGEFTELNERSRVCLTLSFVNV